MDNRENEALRELMEGSHDKDISATFVDPPHRLNRNQAIIGVVMVAALFMIMLLPQQNNPTGFVISDLEVPEVVPTEGVKEESTQSTQSTDLITGAVIGAPQESEPLFPASQIGALNEIHKAEYLAGYEKEIETSQLYAPSEDTIIMPYTIGRTSQYFYMKPIKVENKKRFLTTFTIATDFLLDQTDAIEMLFLFYNHAGSIIQTKNFVYTKGNVAEEELVTGIITKEKKVLQISGKEQIILDIEITPDIEVGTFSIALIPWKEETTSTTKGNIILYEADIREV